MSESSEMAAASKAPEQPASEGLADAVRDPAVPRDRAGTLPAGLRAGLRRSRRRDRRDQHDPAAPDFANTITALERSGKLLSRVAAVFYDLVSAHSNPELLEIDKEVSLRMARHWNPIMMNAVLFGRIARAARHRADARADRRADCGCWSAPIPASTAPAPGSTSRQEADGRDQRAAGPSRHRLQPPSARRRAGLVHGARRGRSRRPFRTVLSQPPGPRPRSAAWPARRS